MILNRDNILKADDLKRETITIAQWGGDVIVSQFGGADRDIYDGKLLAISNDPTAMAGLRALVCSLALVDETGAKLFTPDDIDQLGKKSDEALTLIFTTAQKINGLGWQAEDDAKKN